LASGVAIGMAIGVAASPEAGLPAGLKKEVWYQIVWRIRIEQLRYRLVMGKMILYG